MAAPVLLSGRSPKSRQCPGIASQERWAQCKHRFPQSWSETGWCGPWSEQRTGTLANELSAMSLCCARWRPAPGGPGRRRCALGAVLLVLLALLWLGVARPELASLPQGRRPPAGTNASIRLDPGLELEGGNDGDAMRTVWCASAQPQVLPRLPKEARFRAFLRHSHCRYFPLLRDHPDKCGGRVRLLLAVKSAPEHGERREAVRRTWGRELTGPGSGSGSDFAAVRTVFLLGRGAAEEGPSGEALRQRLEQEDRAHGDLLRWDFNDTFYNLTLKAVNFLRWFQHRCPTVEFVFQGCAEEKYPSYVSYCDCITWQIRREILPQEGRRSIL